MAEWTDELKQTAIDLYLKGEPTPENSMEVVKEVADAMDQSPNGVRMILSKAGVYVKKEAASGAKKATSSTASTTTRVSKEDAHAQLVAAIESRGATVDMEIVSKLTGKAAIYLAGVLGAE
jgi:transposase-like protein